MKPWIAVWAEALVDLENAQDYFGQISPQLKEQFTLEVEDAIEHIQTFPKAYPKVFGEVRRFLIKRFSYLFYYRVYPDRIEVIAVLHSRRDPRIWQTRVEE